METLLTILLVILIALLGLPLLLWLIMICLAIFVGVKTKKITKEERKFNVN